MPQADPHHRRIRSFVRRQGRMTQGQVRAFAELWPKWGLSLPESGNLDLLAPFGNPGPIWLEIGFGNGDNLAALAERHAGNNYLGVEVHRPGVGHLLLELEARKLDNVRLLCDDAVEVLSTIPDGTLDGCLLLFPDPWHKKRHHKRRILQPSLVEALGRVIRKGGLFQAATDWEDYARHMMSVLTESEAFKNTQSPGQFAPRPEERPVTRFEKRGQRLGHEVFDLVFQRRA